MRLNKRQHHHHQQQQQHDANNMNDTTMGVKRLPKKGVFRLRSIFGSKSKDKLGLIVHNKNKQALLLEKNNNNNNSSSNNNNYDDHISETFSPMDESSFNESTSLSSTQLESLSIITHNTYRITMDSCAALLNSENVNDNRAGLEKLLEASNPNQCKNEHHHQSYIDMTSQNSSNSSSNSSSDYYYHSVAHAIVYGDGADEDSMEEYIRSSLLTFICNYDSDDDDDDYYYYEDRNDNNEAGSGMPHGNIDEVAALHLLSLQLIARSLEYILNTSTSEPEPVDFTDPFWSNTVSTLIHNIELVASNTDITGYSLKCVRLLHSLEPILVKQMLQHRLMPYIIHLREHGETQKLPMIESEASRLLKRADIQATRYVTI